MFKIFALWKAPKVLPPALSFHETKDFLRLLDKIERERLKDVLLRLEVAGYMFRTGISHKELMQRYQAVCPAYRREDFFFKTGLDKAGEWAETYRGYLTSKIRKELGEGPIPDLKERIENAFSEDCADFTF